MAPPVYTQTLYRGDVPGAAETLLFQVPAGVTYVLRDIFLTLHGTVASDLVIFIHHPVQAVRLWQSLAAAPGKTEHLELRQAMRSPEWLTVASGADPVYVSITGYVFSDPVP